RVHVLLLAGAVSLANATGPMSQLHATRAMEMIYALDLDSARKELEAADLDDPTAAVERGRLAIYEEDCDGALVTLGRPEVMEQEEAQALADIARGCSRVTAATEILKDEPNNIVIRLQDSPDRSL